MSHLFQRIHTAAWNEGARPAPERQKKVGYCKTSGIFAHFSMVLMIDFRCNEIYFLTTRQFYVKWHITIKRIAVKSPDIPDLFS